MSNVTLVIGGQSHTIACAAGEEAHIQALGRMIDGKLAGLPGAASQSPARALLFAALLLADELHETRQKTAASASVQADPQVLDQLDLLAARFENLAALLEGQPANP